MRRSLAVVLAVAALTVAAGGADAQAPVTSFPDPVDPQTWELPEHMTWDDHVPIPGYDWTDPGMQPPRTIRAALILGDFADRPFVTSLPEGSDEAGNPQGVGSVPRDELADFWAGFLNTPQELNHGHTMNEYWLEDSYGRIGVDVQGFGPYQLSGKEHEYGMGGGDAGGAGDACPAGDSCGQNFDNELVELSLIDVTIAQLINQEDYDFRYLLHAGYDESGTWQEFGEMRFAAPEDVTEEFGNPDPSKPEWSGTRYIDWTSFWAGKGIWSHALPGALSTQGESDGQSVFAHELSHIFGVLDNYNNPYEEPVRRAYSGPWEMLSRGTFNGPGGTHTRWHIPGTQGGSMGSHHMLRNKLRLGFAERGVDVIPLERDLLALTGPLVFDIYPRALPTGPGTPHPTGLHGLEIILAGGDDTPSCSVAEDHACDGGGYQTYTVEVVDRIGFDSFTPDHGVLIAKNKLADTAPFIWVTDAHPEDIDVVDFIEPDGDERMVTLGDPRQLADALFHAGTGEGVVHEAVDEPNRLHFYVLANARDDDGVLTYRVAVRSLDGAGPFTRGVAVVAGDAPPAAAAGEVVTCTFTVNNSGNGTDLVRLATSAPPGWETYVTHEVIELASGGVREVDVWARAPAAGGQGELELTVTSESDASASASAPCALSTTGGPSTTGTTTTTGATGSATTTGTTTGAPMPATGGGLAVAALALLSLAALTSQRPNIAGRRGAQRARRRRGVRAGR